jgi:hypothetical protein
MIDEDATRNFGARPGYDLHDSRWTPTSTAGTTAARVCPANGV